MSSIWDVGVIGAGAAGLMTAIQCAELGLKVLLIDGKEKIGAKILMSGGTRCNVTNQKVTERDYFGGNPRVIRNILATFPSDRTVEFFQEIGVNLILEEGGKYFPESQKAQTVLDALVQKCSDLGVEMQLGHRVGKVERAEEGFHIQAGDSVSEVRALVLSTGGLSYPGTGSDGFGFQLAKNFGHSIIPTTPALTPLKSGSEIWTELSGVSFKARLTLVCGNQKTAQAEGDFLFTHFGFSGPVVLDMSRHWIRSKDRASTELWLDCLPQFQRDQLWERWLDQAERYPRRAGKSFFVDFLPERFVERVFEELDLEPYCPIAQFSKDVFMELVDCLKGIPLDVSDVYGYAKAEVTAGGVSLDEVDPRHLESSLVPGLYFSGEVLDVDGRIGGFNFQWAWSSARAVALGIKRKLSKSN